MIPERLSQVIKYLTDTEAIPKVTIPKDYMEDLETFQKNPAMFNPSFTLSVSALVWYLLQQKIDLLNKLLKIAPKEKIEGESEQDRKNKVKKFKKIITTVTDAAADIYEDFRKVFYNTNLSRLPVTPPRNAAQNKKLKEHAERMIFHFHRNYPNAPRWKSSLLDILLEHINSRKVKYDNRARFYTRLSPTVQSLEIRLIQLLCEYGNEARNEYLNSLLLYVSYNIFKYERSISNRQTCSDLYLFSSLIITAPFALIGLRGLAFSTQFEELFEKHFGGPPLRLQEIVLPPAYPETLQPTQNSHGAIMGSIGVNDEMLASYKEVRYFPEYTPQFWLGKYPKNSKDLERFKRDQDPETIDEGRPIVLKHSLSSRPAS